MPQRARPPDTSTGHSSNPSCNRTEYHPSFLKMQVYFLLQYICRNCDPHLGVLESTNCLDQYQVNIVFATLKTFSY